MKFLYAKQCGIIDYFELAMTEEEAVKKLIADEELSDEELRDVESSRVEAERQISEYMKQIKEVVKRETEEEPKIIRFFAIPDCDMNRLTLYSVAKIENNGETFIFGDDKEIINKIGSSQFDVLAL